MSRRTRPPAHQNKFAWKPGFDTEKTEKIMAIPNVGLCKRCHDIIEWRKQFRKYKPLSKPRKCNACALPKVRAAYHHLCPECAKARDVCPKCETHREIFGKEEEELADLREEIEFLSSTKGQIPGMTERERRTILRDLVRKVNAAKKPSTSGAGADEEDADYEEAMRREMEALGASDDEAEGAPPARKARAPVEAAGSADDLGSGDSEEESAGHDEGADAEADAPRAARTLAAPTSYTDALEQADEVGAILSKALAAAKQKAERFGSAEASKPRPAAVPVEEGEKAATPAASDPWEVQNSLNTLIVMPKKLPKKAVVAEES